MRMNKIERISKKNKIDIKPRVYIYLSKNDHSC